LLKINIESLKFNCIIGILPFERKNKQKVICDISFKYFYNKKSSFIDYAKVVKLIKKTMKKKRFRLIEDAVINIRKKLKKDFKIKKLKIKISKPDILKNCVVSVEE